MVALTEKQQWEDFIFRIETDTVWIGGEEGTANNQGRQLANRTRFLKAMVEALGTGKQDAAVTLAVLATLAGSADKLAYFTGANSAALTSFTAFARTLVAAADAAAVRAAIGAVTKADLDAAVAALVNSSPETLNTLNEFAAALGNDPNFATTIISELATKAPLDSPALITPTATTPGAADKSTRIATTAWLYSAMSTVMTFFGFACSLTANGYIKAPSILGGWILQWGGFTVTAGILKTIPLPVTFPTGSFACAAIIGSSNATASQYTTAFSTNQQISIAINSSNNSGTYFALGS